MCLITLQPKDLTVSDHEFGTAILNNPDGFGVAVPDGEGGIFVNRSSQTGNIEDIKSLLAHAGENLFSLIHLRYTTKGATNLRNAHPFPILEKETDGVDVRMAHNGTIHKFSNSPDKDESDTRFFVRCVVRPLFKRLIKGMSSEELFKDEWVKGLLEEFCPATSVLAFIDGYGNTLVINDVGNGGYYDEDGAYFSNKYSFDEYHRTPKPSQGKNYGNGGVNGYWDSLEEKWYNTYNTQTGYAGPKEGYVLEDKRQETKTIIADTSAIKGGTDQKRFSDKYDLADIESLFQLSDHTIEKLVDDEPEDAEMLIKELLFEWYHDRKQVKNLQNQLTAMKQKLSKGENA